MGWKTNYDYSLTQIFEHLSNYSSSQGVNHTIIQPGTGGHIHVGTVTRGPNGSGFSGSIPGTPQFKGVKLMFPDGNWYVFQSASTGLQGDHYGYSTVYTLPGKPWTITQQNDGSYIAFVDNKYYHFDTTGRLTGIKDKANKGVTLAYNNLQTIITDNSNRQLIIADSIDGNGNTLISGITLPDNTYISYNYSYTVLGGFRPFLTYVDRPGGEDAWYDYLPQIWNYYMRDCGFLSHQKDLRKDSNREIFYNIEYVGNYQKYTSEYDKAYSGNCLARLTYNAGNTAVTDKDGVKTYYFNQYGAVSQINDGEGGETRDYDANARLAHVRYKNGMEEQYYYDQNGNVNNVTTLWPDPTGSRVKNEYYTYDTDSNLTDYTDGNNHKTHYTYDYLDRVTSIVTGGKETSYSYNAQGLVEAIHDGENMSKSYTYDQYGNVTQILNNATGGTETFTYYDNGVIGKLYTHTGEDGVVKTYTYDPSFQSKFHTIFTNGGSTGSETVTYGYDARGNMNTMHDNMGSASYVYNQTSDLLQSQADRANGTKTYTYDTWRRMTHVTDNAGGSRIYNYDGAGRIRKVTSRLFRTLEISILG